LHRVAGSLIPPIFDNGSLRKELGSGLATKHILTEQKQTAKPNKRIERDGGEQLSSNQVQWPPPLMLDVGQKKSPEVAGDQVK
jgi:hypothetical protein